MQCVYMKRTKLRFVRVLKMQENVFKGVTISRSEII